MVRTVLYIIVYVFIATISVYSQGKQDGLSELQKLKSLYDKKVKDSIHSLQTNFIENLDDLEKRLAAQRKLELALLVREERVRISLDPLAEADNDRVFQSPELKRLVEIYERHRESRVRPVRAIYLTALKRLESRLIGERRLSEALNVRKEIKSLELKNQIVANTKISNKENLKNLALAANGAKAMAPNGAKYLIDGITKGHTRAEGYAWGSSPCDFVVYLPKTQQVSQVKVYFWDGEKGRRYQYKIFLSRSRGDDWEELPGRNRLSGYGWQEHDFQTKTADSIKIVGLGNTTNKLTQIVEIEVR